MTSITIHRGDTLSKLARQQGTTVEKLAQANHIKNPNKILAGAKLVVPGKADVFETRGAQHGKPPSQSGQTAPQPSQTAPRPAQSGDVFTEGKKDAPTPAQTQAPSTSPGPSGNGSSVHVKTPWISQFTQPNPNVACYRTSVKMANQAGAKVNTSPSTAMWLNAAPFGKKTSPQEARSYMDGQLNAGKPVMVGVDRPGGSNLNADKITDHWIVVTGRGVDDKGRTYYTFNDPGTRHAEKGPDSVPQNRLYLDEKTGKLSRPASPGFNQFTMTSVRTNANSPGRSQPAQTSQAPQPRAESKTPAQSTTQPAASNGTGRANDLKGGWKGEGRDPNQYDAMINESAKKYGVAPRMLKAMMQQESHFKPNAVSPAGAKGLIQIMPDTFKELGGGNPFDPSTNIDHAAKYLGQLMKRYHGNPEKALAAYNWGMGNLEKKGMDHAPAETRNYVHNIMNSYNGVSYK